MTRRPSLAIDARALWGSGIGRYMREITRGLVSLGKFDLIRLVGDPKELEPFVEILESGATASKVDIVALKGGRYSPRAQAGWSALLAHGDVADVTFFPHWDVPLLRFPTRSVVTIHDLIHLRVKGATSPARRVLARRMITRAVDEATRMIAVSAFSRDDLIAEFPAAAGRIEAVPSGVSTLFAQKAQSLNAVSADIRRPYLLCVANRKPHKNLIAAVEVLAQLVPTHQTLRLVCVGEHFPEWKRTIARARELGVEDRIVDLGAIPDETLHSLYANAAVYLHPSRYEGFGFPVLEAMASGAPVVASNTTSIPEIAGTAATLVDPDDYPAMSAAVAVMLDKRATRDRASAAGKIQAARFSWESAVLSTQRILLEAAAL